MTMIGRSTDSTKRVTANSSPKAVVSPLRLSYHRLRAFFLIQSLAVIALPQMLAAITVTGIVTARDTSSPLANIRVTLSCTDLSGTCHESSTVTDSAGMFSCTSDIEVANTYGFFLVCQDYGSGYYRDYFYGSTDTSLYCFGSP